ncbi:prolyl oligopeptidase family serine peptidase [Polluticaenibacter yanchengensis]|uniref:Alpha/beta hydrolase n=1 Tax=Polluticaenibacter yanchengensis TaxID=3014562 RepID=A0ABT4UMK1_9BACT|nr:alpha/beta hydrolase [Chitinophagaceae bacterium LY-5]
MKLTRKLLLFIAILQLALVSCKKDSDEDELYKTTESYTLTNIAYSSNNYQNMDIYLPAGRSSGKTKVFVLIHGGSWNSGDKADLATYFNMLKGLFPNHAIANINYRLGTVESPGYTKQLDDVKAALEHLQSDQYHINKDYFLIGASAGAHLAMLYGYTNATKGQVKGICNTVGPTDFTDPAYTTNPVFAQAVTGLVGNIKYADNPQLFANLSPVTHVTAQAPKTISFFGDQDPLIPVSQKDRLHDKLNRLNVVNEAYVYAGQGHGDWNDAVANDFALKLMAFINAHFNY